MAKRQGASMPSWSIPLFLYHLVFISTKALWTVSIWVVTDASLHRWDWLSHWQLAISSTSSPSPLSGNSGDETESSNPPVTRLVSWKPAPILRASSHLMSITKDIFTAVNTLEFSKVLRALCQKLRLNMLFFFFYYKSQYHKALWAKERTFPLKDDGQL